MAIPTELKKLADDFFDDHSLEFDLSLNEGCGAYTEAFVRHAQSHNYPKVGHLKKSGGATQYNGHANDAFLYNEMVPPSGLLQAVDIIARAEQKPPYGPGKEAPGKNFGIDEPRYKVSDWQEKPDNGGENNEHDFEVPWVPYNENGFDVLKKQLKYDYGRRPQNADFDVSVWASRVFHSCYMGPDGKPLGFVAAMKKHRPEWCQALGVSVDDHWES